jgi:hypothetical protein
MIGVSRPRPFIFIGWRSCPARNMLLLGGPKIDWNPRTQWLRNRSASKWTRVVKDKETKNLRKPVHVSSVVNPFIRALAPPFIGRRRDFYIPRLPSNLMNIPNVNMYKNVFYIPWFARLISYIYKSVTSSHSKPGLLKCLWLGFLLTPEAVIHGDHRLTRFLRPHQIPELRRFPIPSTSQILDTLNFASFQLSWNG